MMSWVWIPLCAWLVSTPFFTSFPSFYIGVSLIGSLKDVYLSLFCEIKKKWTPSCTAWSKNGFTSSEWVKNPLPKWPQIKFRPGRKSLRHFLLLLAPLCVCNDDFRNQHFPPSPPPLLLRQTFLELESSQPVLEQVFFCGNRRPKLENSFRSFNIKRHKFGISI